MDRMTKMILFNGSRNNGNDNRSRMDYGGRDNGRMRPRNEMNYGNSMEYNGGFRNSYDMRGDYDMESRFRDRRGREHYDNGRYAPMRNEYDPDRYTIVRGEYENDYPRSHMNTIGFADSYEQPSMHGGGSQSGSMEYGYSSGGGAGKLTEEIAKRWVGEMKNSDGSHGEHWTMPQVKQLIAQKRLDCDPVELYAALNATYSDLEKFFKKYNINSMDAYIDYAKMFWLEDEDAVDDKLANYFMYIVK